MVEERIVTTRFFIVICNECGCGFCGGDTKRAVIKNAKVAGWFITKWQTFCPRHLPLPVEAISVNEEAGHDPM